ncbi:MAG: hypothetical protein DELT_01612 [Desulfovibrio sp.]
MRIGDMAASAMNAFSVDMMARANNIANMNTNGFQAQNVTLTTGPLGQGVAVGSIYHDTSPGPLVPGYDPTVNGTGYVEGSNTDIAREFVHMISDQHAYAANATVVRTYDDMMGTLVNMMV